MGRAGFSGAGRARGFTLVELMVVVIIIAVLAVIAMPSIARRMQDRRTQQAAYEISALYRDARMRALGRGSAMLVRFDTDKFEVHEAVRGADNTGQSADCQRLPISSCFVNWTNANDSRLVSRFEPDKRQGMKNVKLGIRIGVNAQTKLDVCFTPMGRAYSRTVLTNPMAPLVGVPVAEIWREDPDDHSALGLMRNVLILPNGNARLGTSEPKP